MLARSGNSLPNSSQFFSDSADSLDEVVNNSPLFQRITEMEVDRSKTSIRFDYQQCIEGFHQGCPFKSNARWTLGLGSAEKMRGECAAVQLEVRA